MDMVTDGLCNGSHHRQHCSLPQPGSDDRLWELGDSKGSWNHPLQEQLPGIRVNSTTIVEHQGEKLFPQSQSLQLPQVLGISLQLLLLSAHNPVIPRRSISLV